jgi:hypothetical protein
VRVSQFSFAFTANSFSADSASPGTILTITSQIWSQTKLIAPRLESGTTIIAFMKTARAFWNLYRHATGAVHFLN